MIYMYYYTILYNKHKIYIFINEECIYKYKLRDYEDFEKLIKHDELVNLYKIDYEINSLKFDDYNKQI